MRNPNRLRLAPRLGFLVLFLCCGRTYAQAPSITGLSPTSGPVGTLVIISGSNFGATQGSSTIALNGTTAAVVSWGATSISALVPSGASSGAFSVTVSGAPASSASFTITPLPSGWSDGDVGSVGVAGTATYANGVFTVEGAGSETHSREGLDVLRERIPVLRAFGEARENQGRGSGIPAEGGQFAQTVAGAFVDGIAL